MTPCARLPYAIHRGRSDTFFVLLHGLGQNRSYLGGLARLLALNHWSYVSVDLPGHGLAGHVVPTGYDGVVAYLAAICEREGIRRIIPVGYSFGGFVALALARRCPLDVEALVLIASSYEVSPETITLNFILWQHWVNRLINHAAWLRSPHGNPHMDFSVGSMGRSDLHLVYHTALATPQATMSRVVRFMRAESLKSGLVRVEVPVMIVQPELDQFFRPAAYRRMEQILPRAWRRVVPCTHNVAPFWPEIFHLLKELSTRRPGAHGRRQHP